MMFSFTVIDFSGYIFTRDTYIKIGPRKVTLFWNFESYGIMYRSRPESSQIFLRRHFLMKKNMSNTWMNKTVQPCTCKRAQIVVALQLQGAIISRMSESDAILLFIVTLNGRNAYNMRQTSRVGVRITIIVS